MDDTKKSVAEKGYVETIFGRKRYLPDINSRMPQLQAAAERMAINHPIQGTGADIIKLAMIQIYGHLHKAKLEDKVRMLLQVHDELVFEIKDELVKEESKILKDIMEKVYKLDVPLTVDVKVGDNWQDMS